MGVNKSLSKRLAWWQADGYPIKRLYDGLSILNNLPKESFHNEFGRLYTALEAFANGRAIATRTDTAGPTRRFSNFVEHIVSDYSQGGVLLAENVSRRLLEMDPLIANVGDNNDDPFEAHREFQIKVTKYSNCRDEISLALAGKALGDLLCVIRGNTVHPDKSSGYLRSERTRNRIVLKAGIAVIQSLLERALNTPSSRLAVYGSLYRNGDNHEVIGDLGEPWMGQSIGVLSSVAGYPVFDWEREPPGTQIPFEVYSSPRLTEERWKELDDFEGNVYRRLLLPIERLDDATCIVATAYGTASSD